MYRMFTLLTNSTTIVQSSHQFRVIICGDAVDGRNVRGVDYELIITVSHLTENINEQNMVVWLRPTNIEVIDQKPAWCESRVGGHIEHSTIGILNYRIVTDSRVIRQCDVSELLSLRFEDAVEIITGWF